MQKEKKSRISLTVWPFYIWTALFVALPMVYVVVISFLQRGATWGVTAQFTLDNYLKMIDPMYGAIFLEALYVAVLTTLITFLVGYPFAYYVCKLPARLRSLVILLLMAPFWINSLCRLNGWMILLKSNGVINSILQALGIVDEPLKLLYNFGAVIVGMVYALAPFMILSCYNSIEKMDWAVVEASRDLGASPFKAFLTVTLPLTMPGIVAGCVLVFVPSVGLFFISDLMGGAKTVLIGNLIRTEMTTARNWPFGAALSMMMLVVTIGIIWVYKKVSGSNSLGDLM